MIKNRSDSCGKILIVDDDKFMRDLLNHYLSSAGYTVYSAHDGAQAWDILDNSQHAFDIVLTDRNMPVMDGMQLLAKIKQDSRFTDLPVIFQTAQASREAIVEGLSAGVYHYLTKPYDTAVLMAFVDAAIDEAKRHSFLKKQHADANKALALLDKAEFKFQTLDEAQNLTLLLAELSGNPGRVVTGLSELLVNAVEHGNLGISYREKTELVTSGRWQEEVDSRLRQPQYGHKKVHVRVVREDGAITFSIKDQGRGFDPAPYLEFSPERATDVHGRGIAMSKVLSFDSLEYVGCGNQVIAKLLIV